MISSIHFMGLAKSLESPEFIGLEVQSSMSQPKVMIEPLHGEGPGKTFLAHRQKGTSSQVIDSSEVVSTVSALFNEGYETAICRTKSEQFVYTRTNKGVRIQ